MAGLIHYQPLTGPVWREPVAAALAWIPRGEPARLLERRTPSEFVFPPFYELYNPAGLHWLPSGRWPLYPEVRKLGDFQQPIQFAAPAFDPQHLEWIPQGPAPRTLLELRKLGDFAQPAFDALYKPEGLQWLFEGQLSVRSIPYTFQTLWVVDTNPAVTIAFDPQFFPFQATDILLARGIRAALQSDFTTPPLPPGPDVPPASIGVERFSGGWEYARRSRKRLEEELRSEREQWGILPKAAQIVSAIAIRQADALDLDAEQRLEELERELELAGVAYQTRYLELLNLQRQRLIDAEIRGYFEAQDALNEENARRLLLLLAFL